MSVVYNPRTKKLDFTWSTWTENAPVTWTWNPNGVIISRYAWDQYLDTATGLLYVNTTVGDTGWEIFQTQPAA